MVYFKMKSVNPLCHGPSVQIAQACKTDTMHSGKARKREFDTGFMSSRWQHIHNAPCCGEGSKLGSASQISWANWWHWYHQTVLCHWLHTCTASLPATVMCWGFWDNPAIHVPFSSLLKELSGVCRWEELTLALPKPSWGLEHHLPSQAAMGSLAQHRLVVLDSESSSMSPPTKANTWQAKESTEHLGPDMAKSHFPELVSSHISSLAPQHARLVIVPGVNSIWQLPCRLMTSQGTPGDPQVALLPLLTSVLWVTLMATWQAGDRWM